MFALMPENATATSKSDTREMFIDDDEVEIIARPSAVAKPPGTPRPTQADHLRFVLGLVRVRVRV